MPKLSFPRSEKFTFNPETKELWWQKKKYYPTISERETILFELTNPQHWIKIEANNRSIYYQVPNADGSVVQYHRWMKKKKAKTFSFFIAPCHHSPHN